MNYKKIRVWISIILCITCFATQIELACAESAVNCVEENDISKYVNNEILIKLSENCPEVKANAILKNANVTVIKQMKSYVVVHAATKRILEDAIKYFKKSTYIDLVQPNFEYEQSNTKYTGTYVSGGITFSQNQWGLMNDGTLEFVDAAISKSTMIQAKKGIDINVTPLWVNVKDKVSKRVIVAVIDTGVDINHPSFKGKLWKNAKEIPEDGIDNDKNGYIDDYDGWNSYSLDCELTDEVGHGTHCAGIIAANGKDNVWGVTGESNVKIMPVKVFSKSKRGDKESCRATSFSILWGLEYAQENGAKVCNLSLGMEESDSVLREFMRSSNMLFICAAGNNGTSMEGYATYPAYYNFPNIISVANIRCDGNINKSSNYSRKRVGVAAPGTEIYSTLPDNDFGFMTGSSMAAPYVTGVAALLYSYTNRINAVTAKNQIEKTATKMNSLEKKVSGGLVNAYEAYKTDVSAPSIQYKRTVYKSKGYVSVKLNVADYGNAGVKYVRWLKGSYKASSFQKGKKGVKVSATGTFHAKSSGTYTIYAIDNSGNETVRELTVNVPAPSWIELSRSSVTLKKGASYKVRPYVHPSDVYVKYSYVSTDKKIASVDSKGKVIAKRAGKATIVVKTHNGKRATLKVIVR